MGQAVFVIEPHRQQAIVVQCLSALSLTLRSEGMVPSRTVAVKRCKASAHYVPRKASWPSGREDGGGDVPRQRNSRDFAPFLKWSTSVSASCFADRSPVSSDPEERVQSLYQVSR